MKILFHCKFQELCCWKTPCRGIEAGFSFIEFLDDSRFWLVSFLHLLCVLYVHVAASFFFLISLFIHQEIKFCSLLFTPWNGRNERGREMLSLVENLLEIIPTTSSVKSAALPCWFAMNFFWKKKILTWKTLFQGDRRPFVMETVKADDNAKLGMTIKHL